MTIRRAHEKDLYSILGVTPDATAEEMRDAYVARARIIHPDRFDRQRQPKDWNKANEMLAELNDAYSVLRNPTTRSQYDDMRGDKQQRQQPQPPPRSQRPPEPPPPPAFELGELTGGKAAFGNLPKNVQARLLKRQQNKGEDQFQVKLSSVIWWNYFFIVVLLCWYWYLFAHADGAKWKEDTILWYGGITLVVGGLIGRNCVTILRWVKAKVKPYFYVTPIYFLKTEFDIVSFWPIWTLKDVAATHNYRNGSYQNSEVVLKFDGYNESLSLSSKEWVEALFNQMRAYDSRLRTAYANQDQEYFRKNDDFYHVPRSGVLTAVLLSKGKQTFIYAASVLICGIGLIAAVSANEELSHKRWVRHQTPTANIPEPTPHRVTTPSDPAQPLPYSGAVRTKNGRLYVNIEPEGARVRILNIKPIFYQGIELEPGKYQVEVSHSGYETKVMWVSLGAAEDKNLNIRLERTAPGVPGPARFVLEDTPTAPAGERTAPTYSAQPLPYSGAVMTWTSTERIAPFEIKAAKGSHYLLKLVDASTHAPVMTVFVRGGTTVEIEVPLGTYEVRYASGETWYGYEYLFGQETSYNKADRTFTFKVVGNQIGGFTITLYKVPHGNLHTSAIRPTEF